MSHLEHNNDCLGFMFRRKRHYWFRSSQSGCILRRHINHYQRRWVYASAKRENNYFGFGTDNDLEGSPNYLVIKHAAFPYVPQNEPAGDKLATPVPCAKVLGAAHGRAQAFRPPSIG